MGIEEVFKKKDEQLYNIYKEKATDLEKEYNDVGKNLMSLLEQSMQNVLVSEKK